MKYIDEFKELKKYFEDSDFTDIKVFEGRTTLPRFIAAMLSYYPWWLVWLYRIRELLVNILVLVKHEAPAELPSLTAKDVSFTPGDTVTFFTVRSTKKDVYWMAETPEDKHLWAYFGVISRPMGNKVNRFYIITTVYYKHWTGPVYFNLIRPFHHLVVSQMARAGLKSEPAKSDNPISISSGSH